MITADRLQEMIERVLNAQFDRIKYMMAWEFQVQNVDAGPPVVCQLASIDPRMPNAEVMIRPGADGSYCTPLAGSSVLVAFVAGDPSKPYIFATDPANPPTTVTIAGGGPKAGRVGDEVTITIAEFTAASPVADLTTGVVTITSDMKGTITGGSAKTAIG